MNRRSGRLGQVPLGATAVVVVAVLAAVVLTVLQRGVQGDREVRAEALAAARDRVPLMLGYSHRDLDADLARSKEQTTGTFSDEYAELVEQTLRPQVAERRISTEARVLEAGVVGRRGDAVDVLAVVERSTAERGRSARRETSALELSMRPVDGTWKIAGLTAR